VIDENNAIKQGRGVRAKGLEDTLLVPYHGDESRLLSSLTGSLTHNLEYGLSPQNLPAENQFLLYEFFQVPE
jgi:hypothetical protein